jgi:hypothetical protein
MFSELLKEFCELDLKWKIMVSIGIFSSIVVIILCILFILIFKTDLIQIDHLIGLDEIDEVNLDKYEDLFSKNETGKIEEIEKEIEEIEKEIEEKIEKEIELEMEIEKEKEKEIEADTEPKKHRKKKKIREIIL